MSHDRLFRVGEFVLDNGPPIVLYAESATPMTKSGVGALKRKLSALLDSKFRADRVKLLTIADITQTYRCPPTEVARMIRLDRLHPRITVNDQQFFDTSEVDRVLKSFRGRWRQ